MYILNLAKDGRVLSATYEGYTLNGTSVSSLPDGDISDYKYIDGRYIYDPLPKPVEPEPKPSQEERITELESQLAALTDGYTEGVNQA